MASPEGCSAKEAAAVEEVLSTVDERVETLRGWRDRCRLEGQKAQLDLMPQSEAIWTLLHDALAVAQCDLQECHSTSLRTLLLAALQFFGNLVTGNPETSSVIWTAFFPVRFLELLESTSRDRKLLMCVCVILHNSMACLSNRPCAVNELLSSSAIICKLVRVILRFPQSTQHQGSHASDDPVFEWVYLIFCKVLEEAQGTKALSLMGFHNPGKDDDSGMAFTPEQLVFLHVVEHALDDKHVNGQQQPDSPPLLSRDNGALCVDLVRRARGGGGTSVPLDSVASEVHDRDAATTMLAAEARATVVRILGKALAADESSVALRESLTAEGLVPLLLSVLMGNGGRADGEIPREGRVDGAARELGRKAEAMRTLCNLCYGCRMAQDRVREHGGIPVILNHCNVDSSNPYLREWSLLAVRNLCHDNAENQRCIEELKPQGSIATATLRSMGVEPVMSRDQESGRVRVQLQRSEGERRKEET